MDDVAICVCGSGMDPKTWGQMRAELDWWHKRFMCRFGPNNLPHVGDALLGHRFHLFAEGPGGDLFKWEARGGEPSRKVQ